MKVKVGLVSLGCSKNQVDAEMLLSVIDKDGFLITPDVDQADVIIINTCGFIESAKQESIENILEFCTLKQEGKIKSVVVTGCLVERYKQDIIKEIPEVDVVLGIGSNLNISQAIKKSLMGEKVIDISDKYNLPLEGERILSTSPFYAYVKIAEGCSNGCTYCSIPLIRGKFRSRPMESVLKEIKSLEVQGVKEIILVAQDTGRYGHDLYGENSLYKLLEEITKFEGIRWIRILYCYPERIDEKLLSVIRDNPKILKYIDMPMQHINKRILKEMNRIGDIDFYRSHILNMRNSVPGLVIRTTFIVGFPGETEQEFQEVYSFVKECKLERVGCFAYSKEEGTRAAIMDNHIDEIEKERRAVAIMKLQQDIMKKHNLDLIEKDLEVVVEGYDKYAESYYGRSYMDSPEIDGKVFFQFEGSLNIGDFIKVRVFDSLDYDLLAEVLS